MQSSFKSFPFPYSPSVLRLAFSSTLSWFISHSLCAIERSLLRCPRSLLNLTWVRLAHFDYLYPPATAKRSYAPFVFSSPIPLLLYLNISFWVVRSALPISLEIHCPFHLPLSGSDRKAVARTLSLGTSIISQNVSDQSSVTDTVPAPRTALGAGGAAPEGGGVPNGGCGEKDPVGKGLPAHSPFQ